VKIARSITVFKAIDIVIFIIIFSIKSYIKVIA